MKPICVPCERFYRPATNGYRFLEGMPIENGAKPGRFEPEKWKPYKFWCGDLWQCPSCGHKLISGVAAAPIAEHYEPVFIEAVRPYGGVENLLLVKDC